MKQCVWVRPKLIAVVEFLEWTEGDRLRHSKFVALREDKNPREVVRFASSRVKGVPPCVGSSILPCFPPGGRVEETERPYVGSLNIPKSDCCQEDKSRESVPMNTYIQVHCLSHSFERPNNLAEQF